MLAPVSAPSAARAPAPTARNVILFVTDGASSGTWDMTSYWEHGELGRQPYDSWPVRLGMTTFPATTRDEPSGGQAPRVSYEAAQAWSVAASTSTLFDRPSHFAGYHYIKQDATDSAAAGTALATGVKTYNGGISMDDTGAPLELITEIARTRGMATGVVSSVPFSHATPAVFGARNTSRSNYAAIARDMINGTTLDVIIGTGNPDFDGDARPRSPDYRFVGEADWMALRGGTTPRALVQDTRRFEAMARGEQLPPGPMIGVPQVGETLQFGRTATVRGPDPGRPSGVEANPGVPSLPTLTQGALNMLGRDPDGFFLMVEGGAVDWAAHANDTGRVIEEQADFNAAVRAALGWLEAQGLTDSTLVIVLTDHGNGLPLGPDSDAVPFQPVQNRGKGVLPGVRWHTPTHTNENTRLWATGPGASALVSRVRLYDPGLASRTGHNADGATVDNTDVFAVMKDAITPR